MPKVMLVEDDATMLSLLKTLLEIEGFEVAQIVNFNNILGEVKHNQPDVVLMDVNLKGQNGLDTLVAIRADAEMVQPHVILSSGMDYRHEAESKGADAFVLKPYMPDELIEKIKEFT